MASLHVLETSTETSLTSLLAGPAAGSMFALWADTKAETSILSSSATWWSWSPKPGTVQRNLPPVVGLTRATDTPTVSALMTSTPSMQTTVYHGYSVADSTPSMQATVYYGCSVADWFSHLIPSPLSQPRRQREPYFRDWTRYLALCHPRAQIRDAIAGGRDTSGTPDKVHRLLRYLESISSGNEDQRAITPEMAWLGRRAWAQLAAATNYRLLVPNACAGPNGELLFTWDRREHHFELEVSPDGHAVLFYANRSSNDANEAEFEVGDRVPVAAIPELQFFV